MDPDVEIIDFNFFPPVRFGSKYFEALQADPFVDIFLNSNLIDVTSYGNQVTSIEYLTTAMYQL